MYDQQNSSIMRLYAISPVHAGSGSSLGVVDLPIQRERHTQWPVINSSGVKGAIRAHFDRFKKRLKKPDELESLEQITENIFGSENADIPGALSVSDARILAFPMRSSVAPFVWITAPSVLKRLIQDLALTQSISNEVSLPEFDDNTEKGKAFVFNGALKGTVLLEDIEVTVDERDLTGLSALKPYFKDADRLLVVHDEVFKYGVQHCTAINAQIAIDQKTGTTKTGSLRYAEELPADTIMYVVTFWGDSKNIDSNIKADMIKRFIQEQVMDKFIQIGGDETLGRGLFKIDWMGGDNENGN